MDLGLKDKVALVTGAGSQVGFGKVICLTLAKEGCHIVASDIDFEGAKKTAAEVEALGRKALAIKVRHNEKGRDPGDGETGPGEVRQDRHPRE